ncbi:MAG TPA: hypothetical protein VGL15_15830 [Vicinamibacteria bacterium]|jgi:hypothetical protein
MTRPGWPLWKVIACVYLVKTLVVAALWICIPELPQKAMSRARETWSRVSASR